MKSKKLLGVTSTLYVLYRLDKGDATAHSESLVGVFLSICQSLC